MRLELFWVLEYSFDKSQPSNTLLSTLVETLLYIFQYEKFQLKFVKAHNFSFKDNVKNALTKKNQKNQLVSININPFGNNKPKVDEDDAEEGKGDS